MSDGPEPVDNESRGTAKSPSHVFSLADHCSKQCTVIHLITSSLLFLRDLYTFVLLCVVFVWCRADTRVSCFALQLHPRFRGFTIGCHRVREGVRESECERVRR